MSHFTLNFLKSSDQIMAEQVNWQELLDKKYPSYRVEVQAFLDNAHISRSTDVSVQKIYEAIKDDPQVKEELKMLYNESIFGNDKSVKNRMRNWMANFCRSLRGHPIIKQMDMVHASDCSNMDFQQLERTIESSKAKDQKYTKGIKNEEDRKCKIKMQGGDKKMVTDGKDSNEEDDEQLEKKAKQEGTSETRDDYDFDSDSAFDFFVKRGDDKPAKRSDENDDDDDKIVDGQLKLQLEPGDYVFSDDDEVNPDDCSLDNLKTYEKKSFASRKKLLPKKVQKAKKNLPSKKDKAEEQFDKILKDAKVDEQGKAKPGQIDELMASFNNPSTSDLTQQDKEILDEIKRATASMNKNSIEQTAYFRALGAANNLNMDKFRDEVQKEIDDKLPQAKKDPPASGSHIDATSPDVQADINNSEIKQDDVESFQGDGLPNIGNDDSDPIYDPFWDDDAETITIADSDESNLVRDDTPFYPNQEEDPEVQQIMFQDFFAAD